MLKTSNHWAVLWIIRSEKRSLLLFVKQSFSDDEEEARTKVFCEKNVLTSGIDLTTMCLRNNVRIITDEFQKYVTICKSDIGNNPIYSYSTLKFTSKSGFKNSRVEIENLTVDKLIIFLKNKWELAFHL